MIVVDTTAPDLAIQSPADGSTIATTRPTISGTSEPGQVVSVTVDGASLGTTTAGLDGTWSLPVTWDLADGEHTAVATATDDFDRTSTVDSTFTVDSEAPAVAITTPEDGSTITDPTPIILGTADPDATLSVSIDGVAVGTTVADASGVWSVPTTAALSDGLHVATAVATDASGNSASATSMFTVVEAMTEPDGGVGGSVSGGGCGCAAAGSTAHAGSGLGALAAFALLMALWARRARATRRTRRSGEG
jgi:hypothetical protein